ncbi:peptide deformylase [Lacticaseibacillus zhaodongensis]|uniref:peptide deformylase n=1 Tax=Lacticaseibacillus zhaodongensis TaxID=2668065 RepID=UPI0012D3239F|nr:peptide deformylase [Lacticaseibacillus zhaodongensis]
MIKPINRDQKNLAIKAVPATPADAQVVTDLLDTLAANSERCVGMAANMIGVNKAIIVVQMGPFAVPMQNPKIIAKSSSYETQEGCLALDGERNATRYQNIEVTFQDRNFKPQRQAFSGFIAQIIQHEMDHCAGIII